MTNFKSIQQVLEFAIEREQEAVEFYEKIGEQTENPALKKTVTAFAAVEAGHRRKLQGALLSGLFDAGDAVRIERGVADYMVDVPAGPTMSLEDAMVVAIKREKMAVELYSDLAQTISEPSLKSLLLQLAREEAGHEHIFQSMYETHFTADN